MQLKIGNYFVIIYGPSVLLNCKKFDEKTSCNLPYEKEICFDYVDGRQYKMTLKLPFDMKERGGFLCNYCTVFVKDVNLFRSHGF